jgi:hypothetical protein
VSIFSLQTALGRIIHPTANEQLHCNLNEAENNLQSTPNWALFIVLTVAGCSTNCDTTLMRTKVTDWHVEWHYGRQAQQSQINCCLLLPTLIVDSDVKAFEFITHDMLQLFKMLTEESVHDCCCGHILNHFKTTDANFLAQLYATSVVILGKMLNFWKRCEGKVVPVLI